MAGFHSGTGLSYGGMGVRGALRKGQEKWFIKEMMADVSTTMAQRVRTACIYLEAKVKENISVPVTYSTGPKGGKIVHRSKPGEYPRMEKKILRGAITHRTINYSKLQAQGIVTVKLDQAPYGKHLEESNYLNRFYLLRTYYENFHIIQRMMTGPMTRFTKLRGASVSMTAGIT